MLIETIVNIVQNAHNHDEAVSVAHQIRDLNRRLALSFSKGILKRGAPIDQGNGASSRQFMIDVLPFIRAYIETYPPKRSFRTLDVGTGSGAGADLLASLYSTKMFGYSMRVSALDIDNNLEPYILATTRYISFVHANIFYLQNTFDIITCNHVIEHVEHPVAFRSVSTSLRHSWTAFSEPLSAPPAL